MNSCFVPDLNVPVRTHLVVVGPNEAGKTSLLKLIDASIGWSTGRLYAEIQPSWLRDPTGALEVRLEFTDFTADDQAAFADEIDFNLVPESLSVRLTVVRAPDDEGSVQVSREFLKTGVKPLRLTARHLEHFHWYLLGAERSADRELGANRRGTVRVLLESVDLGEDADALDDALSALNDALGTASTLGDLRTTVAETLSSVFPEPVEPDSLTIQLPQSHDPLAHVDLQIIDSAGRERSLLEQSDGMRSLAVMSLQLLVNGGASITAVDEPEVHLHPRSQARVGTLLARPAGQRVVATHSPAVLRSFTPSSVLALTREGARQLPDGVVESDPKFYRQWWIDAMLEPLTARRTILVEGVSDELLVRSYASAHGVDLDRLGVSIVGLGGAGNFPNAYRLFGRAGFNIPLSALVDEAEAHYPAEALGVEIDDLSGSGVFVSTPDLEGEYCASLGVERVWTMLIESSFYTEPSLLSALSVEDVKDVSPDQLAIYCRHNRRKIRSAVAISEAATKADLAEMKTITALVAYVVS